MPTIQEYTSRAESSGPTGGPRASSGGSDGLYEIGSALQSGGEVIKKIDDHNAIFQAQIDYNKFSLAQQEKQNQAKNNPESNLNYFESYKETYAQDSAALIEQTSNRAAREHLTTQLGQAQLHFSSQAMQIQAQASGYKFKNDMNDLSRGMENSITANPSIENIMMQDENMKKAIALSPHGTGEMKSLFSDERKTKFWDRGIDAQVTSYANNSAFAPNTSFGERLKAVDRKIAELKDENQPWRKNVSGAQYDASLTKLEGVRKDLMREHESVFDLDFKTEMERRKNFGVNNGMFSESEVRAIYSKNPEKQEAAVRELRASNAIAASMAGIKGAPDNMVAEKLFSDYQSLKDPSLPTADFAVKSEKYKYDLQNFTHRQEMFKRDPAQYTMEVKPEIKDMYTKMEQDPTPQNAGDYVSKAIAAQQYLSPGSIPTVLPDDYVQRMKAGVDSVVRSETGADSFVQMIQGESNKFGKYWGVVQKDFRKVLNAPQYLAATMADDPKNTGIAKDLVRASVMSDATLKDLEDRKITENIKKEARDALRDFKKTVENSSDREAAYMTVEDGLVKLMQYKSFQAGEDMSGETKNYARKILLDKYTFIDKYRIPNNQNVAAIKDGVEVAKNEILTKDLFLPAADLKAGDTKELYLSNLKREGYWAPKGDESGLRFLDGTGRAVFIKNKEGKYEPAEYTWGQLSTMKPEPTVWNQLSVTGLMLGGKAFK